MGNLLEALRVNKVKENSKLRESPWKTRYKLRMRYDEVKQYLKDLQSFVLTPLIKKIK